MSMIRRVISALAALTVVAAAGGAIVHFKRLLPVEAAVPVVASTVSAKDVPIYLHGIGTVAAYNTDVVRSQIQGN